MSDPQLELHVHTDEFINVSYIFYWSTFFSLSAFMASLVFLSGFPQSHSHRKCSTDDLRAREALIYQNY